MNILKITKILSLGLVLSLFLFQAVLAGEVTGSTGSVDVEPEEATSLSVPLGLSAVQTSGELAVNLSWSAVSGATSYKIYRLGADSGWESAVAIATVTSGTSYKDSGLAVDSYYYRVKAFTSALESGFSGTASVSLTSVSINTTTTTTTPPPAGGGGGGGGGGFTPSVSTTTVSGDSNNDGQVNILDFNSLMVNWGSTTVGSVADFNGDNKVDIFDFNFLMINWTL